MNTNPQKRHDNWPVTTPERASLDPQALSDITRSLASSYEYPNVHAVLIEHAGHLVYEHYLEGQDGILGDRRLNVNSLHDVQSVTKSITALLLGIAFGDDIEPALEMPIAEFYENRNSLFSTEARSVTLHQVLSMTAGYRIANNLFLGKHLYIDDLVTSQKVRSRGYGETLYQWLRNEARSAACEHIHLDSEVHRGETHRFYFRQGLAISSFHFRASLAE